MRPLFIATLGLACATLPLMGLSACGSDVQTELKQTDSPTLSGEHLFDPWEVGRECLTSANCEDGDRCTVNRCVTKTCVTIDVPSDECCAADVLFEQTFDGALDGLGFTQLNSDAKWQVIQARAASPPNSLYFGNAENMSYAASGQVAGQVILPEVVLPRDRAPLLTMRVFAMIETSETFDLFQVFADVIVDGAVERTETVLAKRQLPAGAYQDFALVEVPLDDLAGKTVVLRIDFDSVDDSNNQFEGIYIDDLQVLATCAIGGACAVDSDCDDGDDCTLNACSDVGCVQTAMCEEQGASPCDAPDAPADCCVADADCNDGDTATINVCNGATCEATLNPDECVAAADCDDAESCTNDSCNAGLCEYTGVIAEGCCVPGTIEIADFDEETLQGIYVTDNFETGLFWLPDRTRATSGDFSLYCGDPVGQSYDNPRRVKSSATTRPLSIPKGGETTLHFDLYKATRAAKNYDVFQVFVLRDGALLTAWSSKALKTGTTAGWEHIAVPLTTYAGQDVQIRFVFDSVDAPGDGFEGVYIDTLGLDTVCE